MSEGQQSQVHRSEGVPGVLQLSNAIWPVASSEVKVLEIPLAFTPDKKRTQTFTDGNLSKQHDCTDFGPDEVNQYGVTNIEEESFGFVWQLKNYSGLAENLDILSPIFTGGPKSKHSWQLRIIPRTIFEDQEYLGITLCLTDFGYGEDLPDRKIKGRFSISVLKADWKPGVVANNLKYVGFRKTFEWGNKKVLTTTTLTSPEHRFLEDNSLKVQCRIWLLRDESQKIYSGGAALRSLAEEKKSVVRKDLLSLNMGMALKNSLFTDIEIQTDEKVFQAHKAVLAARSSVFCTLLNANGLDSEISKIFIHDFDSEVVQALLDYIYTGKVEAEVLERRAVDILPAAEQYDLDELKEDCESEIGETLTVENASDMLVISDMYRANSLKQVTMEFIDRHKEQIYNTISFQLISKTKPELLGEVYLSTFGNVEGPSYGIMEPISIVNLNPSPSST